MFKPESFRTQSLDKLQQGKTVERILAAAINAVAPDEAIHRFVYREAEKLIIRGSNGDAEAAKTYDLGKTKRVLLFGLGKAASSMTSAMASLLADKNLRGLLVVKHPSANLPEGFEQVVGGHPVPNQGSLIAGQKLKEFLAGSSSDDLLICLISGGGSALINNPVAGVSLADMQALTSTLLGCSASIDEINTLRRHLDTIKGGGLAQMAAPARIISLILSDVIGSPLEAIASGPTAPDPSSLQNATSILEKYKLIDKTPSGILHALQITNNETPKPDGSLFESVQNVVIGDNFLAAQAAIQQAKLEGFQTFYLRGDLRGEARSAAVELCGNLRSALKDGQPVKRPFCLIAGGETTVTLNGNGRGGRNQELALAAVNDMAELPGCMLISLATDGEDGPTEAAGAVVSADTRQWGVNLGLDVDDFLANNDSYMYFSALGDLIKPGPTGTNVNDLTFLFGF